MEAIRLRLTEVTAEPVRDARARWDEMRRMRLPSAAHTSQPWAIHALASDFELEDVWALPTPGGPDDLAALVAMVAGGELRGAASRGSRALFAIRWKVGALLGWDAEPTGAGERAPSLRDRFGPELRAAPTGPAIDGSPFTPLYLLEREYAAEIANATMHGVLHLGWVADGDGYRAQMAVLVKPNGALGRLYMAAIRPFRYAVVYPPMIRQVGRAWAARDRGARTDAAPRTPVASG